MLPESDTRLLYVYCIAPSDEAGAVTQTLLQGIDGEPCECLSYRGLAVTLCRLDSARYNEQAIESKLQDVAWIERNAANHHEVIADVFAKGPVLTMPFCTFFSSLSKLHEALDGRYNEITETFAYLAEKEVWNIKIFCRKNKLREALASDQWHAEQIEKLTPGKQFLMKKKMNQTTDAKVAQEQEKMIDLLHGQLAPITSSNRVQKSWKEPNNEAETMVFNCSYLVPAAHIETFAARLSAFQEEHMQEDEWRIALSGPWPPYQFTSIRKKA